MVLSLVQSQVCNMPSIKKLLSFIVLSAGLAGASSYAQHEHHGENRLELSPVLMDLLRTEMREILSGVESIPAAIAMADWRTVADIGGKISSTYILDQEISAEQRKELQLKLPEYFRKMDESFHAEAKKLELAARDHDPQLATFHYYRLLELCGSCHAAYATSRFPGFSARDKVEHHH
jgi:cytochrome c556